MTDNFSLGLAIKRLRKRSKLTQDDLAVSAGLSKNYICLIERDRRSPSLDAILRISEALSVEVEEIVGENPTIQRLRSLYGHSIARGLKEDLQRLGQQLPESAS